MVIFEQCNLSTILGSNMVNKYGIEKFFTIPNYSLVNQSTPSVRSLLLFSSTVIPNDYLKSDDFTDQLQSKER